MKGYPEMQKKGIGYINDFASGAGYGFEVGPRACWNHTQLPFVYHPSLGFLG